MLASKRGKHSDKEKARGRCELGKALEIGRLWEVADNLKAAYKGWLFNLNTFKCIKSLQPCSWKRGWPIRHRKITLVRGRETNQPQRDARRRDGEAAMEAKAAEMKGRRSAISTRGRRASSSPRGPGPCWHLDLGLLVSRPVREYISVVLSHQVYSNLSLPPQETGTTSLYPYHR